MDSTPMGINLFELPALLALLVILVLLVILLKKQDNAKTIEAIKGEVAETERRLTEELSEQERRISGEISEQERRIAEGLAAQEQRTDRELSKAKVEIENEVKMSRSDTLSLMQTSFSGMANMLTGSQKESADRQDKRLEELKQAFTNMNIENEQRLQNIRTTVQQQLAAMTEDNNKQLEKMRNTVDEKLENTLNERITKSFELVSKRLEEVSRGLGEMQSLASGVGDLKKVLSNVKTRGILGEIQLGAILEQMLSPDQYETNIATKPGSREVVEFAVKLPGEGEKPVYLPIDAKFPADTYAKLVDAYETGMPGEVDKAAKDLIAVIKKEAKDISEKYIYPPDTTDFAIMFLPVEGLYAEVVRRGMVEVLQREYKVNIAGPTTMAALLNSLQMGFRTLAIQKHSSEVWEVLGAVKTEFDKFKGALEKAQQRIKQADSDLDALIGTRTNTIVRKLKNVQQLPQLETAQILGIEEDAESSEEE